MRIALFYAHCQGVLRDIKPSNLILDGSGDIWITDFGLAKYSGDTSLTLTGDLVGTLGYMAPERFQGWSDPRSDIYSLGLTLYELATLRPAFEDSDRSRLIRRILTESPPRPRQLDPRIPRDLETVILKAIAREPNQRFETCGELAQDLERFLAGQPVRARAPSPLERGIMWARRRPASAALGL